MYKDRQLRAHNQKLNSILHFKIHKKCHFNYTELAHNIQKSYSATLEYKAMQSC